MSSDDHHSTYLARALGALTPAGKERIDELLAQLVTAVGGREPVTRFAAALKTDVALGRTTMGPGPEDGLSRQDVNDLLAGFMQIRDREPFDDVADWANAVVALLEDRAAV
ncbi:MAG TPA: hypothetical protein VFG75_09125 [Gaiella sp.]|jgi:hypothetical protein|nr:hypothetical protein [Gaiella sp.]